MNPVGPQRRERIDELFDAVADEAPSEWRRLLEASGEDDPLLITEVLELLAADQRSKGILDFSTAGLAHALLDSGIDSPAPQRFGHYVISEYLGKGGMGSVYLAEREGLGDRVAVKFLHDPWTSPVRRELFAREQRTLAGLSHRYIARLYDAGIADGVPWFAMEYVEGVPLTEYCRNNGLNLKARLELFRCACEAVSYAHRNLIVHLDLKPSNILVNSDGEVKLLDFGIARHLAHGEDEAGESPAGFFSPSHAAPEQILEGPVDVQMDVHALGVVLWELLGGRLPVDVTKRSCAARECVLEDGLAAPSVAAQAQQPPEMNISRSDWADLDALYFTATQRDRGRRYSSVDAFTEDLNRFLEIAPLTAHPKNHRYRLRKFLRRKRTAMLGTTAAVLAILALSGFFTMRLITSREKALASEARTQRMYHLMLNLFSGDDEAAGPSRQLRVVNLLDRGVREADRLGQEPDVQAELRYTLGGLYHGLGHLDRAEPLLLASWKADRVALGPSDPTTVKAQLALARLRIDQSRLQEAEQMTREALEMVKRRHAADSINVANAEAKLGAVFAAQGRYQEAIPLLEKSVKVMTSGAGRADLSEALGPLFDSHYSLGHAAESQAIVLRALALDRKLYGAAHPATGVDLFDLGNLELDRANYREAEKLYRQSLDVNRNWYGESHPKTASTLLMVGRSLAYQGRLTEAAAFYEQAERAMRETYGEDQPRYAVILSLMGSLAVQQHDLPRAEMVFRQAAGIFKKSYGERHEFYLIQLSNLASVRIAAKRFEEAETMLRPALNGLKAAVPGTRYTALTEVRLATALAGQKRYQEAESYAVAGYANMRRLMGRTAVEVLDARKELIEIYQGLGEAAKVEALRVEGG